MAVTRINNNQITDASAGNAYVGINASTKLQAYSITAGKIANNLTYGSDLTVTGNLTVQGTTTAIDTVNTLIQDPLITLADGQVSGAPTVDIGLIGLRGSQNSSFIGWKESSGTFVTALSNTTVSNTTVTVSSYANLATGNLTVQGTTSLVGNLIGPVNATGNISTTGNVTGAWLIGNISGSVTSPGANTNILFNDNGVANATSGFTFDKTSNLVTVGGNVGAQNFNGNVYGTSVSASGTVTAASTVGGVITGSSTSVTGTQTAASTVGGVITGSSSSVTGTQTAASTVGGVITGSSSSVTGTQTAASTVGGVITGSSSSVTGSQTAASTVGGVITGSSVSVTANVTGGNLVSATVTNPTAMTVSTNAGNINLEPTGNIVVNNTYINGLQLLPVQNQDAASKYYVDQAVTTGITIHEAVYAATNTTLATATGGTITYAQPNGVANGVGATLTTTGTYTTIDTANVQTVGTRILVKDQANAVQNGVYVYSNATVITRSTDTDQYGSSSTEELSYNDYFFTTSGNVNAGTAFIVNAPTGTITFGTSNIGFGIFSQSQVYSANTSAGLSLVGTVFSAKVDNNTTAFDGLGNISVKAGANLTTPNIGAATGTSLSVTGSVTAASTIGGVITGSSSSVTGTQTAASTVGGVITGSSTSVTGTQTAASTVGGVITGSSTSVTGSQTAASTVGGVITGSSVSVTGNVDAVSFNGNVYSTTVSASGNITGGNLLTSGSGGAISGSGNITGGNIITGGAVVATGAITGANISVTGNVSGSNLSISGGNITSSAADITVNGNSGDVNFAVNGDTTTIFFADAGTETASFGSATQTTNALVSFNSTNSIKAPVGNTAQRPAVGVTGMLRFNTTNNAVEVYDNSAWTSVGSPTFTVISDQQFSGDGVNVAFTLSSTQTTNSCIVSINGVVQIPTIAYSVSGTDPTCVLTFTEAPATGDLIDVRQITTTTTVTSIANSSGNAVVSVSPTSAQVNVTGDLSVNGTILGGNINSTAITNGTSNVAVASSGGNVRVNIGGTSNVMVVSNNLVAITGDLSVSGNATLSGNILGDRIQNGTTQIDIQTPSGNANITVGGTSNTAVFSTAALTLATNLLPSANVTYNLGSTTQRWNDLWLANSTIYMGNAQISANATSLIFTNPQGGQTVLAGATAGVTGATVSASGNITGGNILTGGIVSAFGNIITGTDASTPGRIGVGTTTPDAEITILANPQTSTYTLVGSSTTLGTDLHIVGADASQTRITQDTFGTGVYVAFTGRAARGTAASPTATQSGDIISEFTGRGFSSGSLQFGNASTGKVDVVASGAFTDTSRPTDVQVFTTAVNAITPTVIATFSSALGLSIPSIVNSGANGVGNIGNSTTYFNTVFAKATSAQYADLAEKYTADSAYAPGTILVFGGSAEVTVNAVDGDRKVAGVVSTNPSYTMNSGLEAEHVATVALTGRVPTMVVGPVRKGDLMVAAGLGRARAEADPRVGSVIGKALEDFDGAEGTIEVVVGRF